MSDPAILLAEHDPFVRAGLRRTLQAAGLGVAGEARSADEAVTAAVTLRADLAIVDVLA